MNVRNLSITMTTEGTDSLTALMRATREITPSLLLALSEPQQTTNATPNQKVHWENYEISENQFHLLKPAV